MALVLADRVRETTTTTGTGSVTLAGAYTGFQTFSAAVGNTNSTYYTIANVGSGEWEVGIGTYSSGGNLLSRTTVLASSNAGSLVNFGAGAKDVFVTQPAERALYVASAGTGLESKVTAFTNGGIVYASSTSALSTGSGLTWSGTNLAVTGTLSATGNANFGNAGSSTYGGYATGGRVFSLAAAGGVIPAISASTDTFASSTAIRAYTKEYANDTSYAFDIQTGNGTGVTTQKLQLTWGANGLWNSTGLAVTGTLTAGATGSISLYDGNLRQTGSGASLYIGTASTGFIQFYNNDSNTMRLDSSGNLGIGITSPINNGGYGGLSLNGTNGALFSMMTNGTESSRIASVGNETSIQSKASTGFISFVQGVSGGTERARIDTSGNLGIGYTTINTTIAVNGNALFGTGAWPINDFGRSGSRFVNASSTEDGYLAVLNMQSGVGANRGGYIYFGARATTGVDGAAFATIGGIRENATSGNYATALVFSTTSAAGAGAERARIDSSGNLGLGATPTAVTGFGVNKFLEIGGTSVPGIVFRPSGSTCEHTVCGAGDGLLLGATGAATASNNVIRFFTSNTNSSNTPSEKMRLDSSGNLLVGTTSNLGGLGGKVQIDSAGSRGLVQSVNANVRLQEYLVSGSTVGFISTDGTNTTYATSSDYRLKNTIAPMTGALAKVALLKPVTYKWNADGSEGQGFIAHELAEIVPECVNGEKDAVDENGKIKPQGIDVSFLVATLTAAIQEMKTIIDTQALTITQLTARITALEGA